MLSVVALGLTLAQAPPPTSASTRWGQDPFLEQAASLSDPQGDRPPGVPRLSLQQIANFALENPAIKAAEQEVLAMEAQLRKARFAWVPIIDTRATLFPGVRLRCDDITLDDGTANGFDFQYCRTRDDNDFNINTVQDYFAQLAEAGIRVEFSADMFAPIFTFGKIRYTKKAAEVAVTLKKLEKLQARHETLLRVHQAYATLALARESLAILRQSNKIAIDAVERVENEVGGSGDDDDWGDDDASEVNLDRDPDDLFKTKLAALEIEELARQARKAEAVALAALWALAGKAAPKGFDILDEPLVPLKVKGGLKTGQDYKSMAFRLRPEARMAEAAVKAREYQERLARANFLPDLGVLVTFAVAKSTAADAMTQWYYNNNFNYTRLSAALVLRWRWDFHNKAFDLQRARAIERGAQYRREAARLLLGQEVDTAYQELLEASHRIALKREEVDLSWKLVVSNQQRDTIGGGDAGELVKYLEKWYRKRFELAEAIQRHNHALAQLSRAVGQELADFSAPKPATTRSTAGVVTPLPTPESPDSAERPDVPGPLGASEMLETPEGPAAPER